MSVSAIRHILFVCVSVPLCFVRESSVRESSVVYVCCMYSSITSPCSHTLLLK